MRDGVMLLNTFPEFVLLSQRLDDLEALHQASREQMRAQINTLSEEIENVSRVTQRGVAEIQTLVSDLEDDPRKNEFNRVGVLTAVLASGVAAALAMALSNALTYMMSTTDKWHRLELT